MILHILDIWYIYAYLCATSGAPRAVRHEHPPPGMILHIFAYMIYLCIFCIFCIFCILCIFCMYDIFVHIYAYICAYFAYFVYFCIFCSAYQICKNIEYMQNIQYMQKLNYMQKHTKYAKKAIQKSRHAKFLGTWRERRGARYDFAYFGYMVYLCIFVRHERCATSSAPWAPAARYDFAYFCIYDIFVHILHILHILHIVHILHVWYICAYPIFYRRPIRNDCGIFDILPHITLWHVFSFLQRCKELFPYTNKKGNSIIETEKMHSIKHAPNDVLRWGDTENMNVEGPENLHKEWVKAQGGKTNQGPTSHRTLMTHCLRKEASALLSEAVQGKTNTHMLISYKSAYLLYFDILYIFYIFIHMWHFYAYSAYF